MKTPMKEIAQQIMLTVCFLTRWHVIHRDHHANMFIETY